MWWSASAILRFGKQLPSNVFFGSDRYSATASALHSADKVTGGGAKSALDKVFQFNGAGKLSISGFTVRNFGKLVRSCGNCGKQYKQYKQTITVSDIYVTAPGKLLVGISQNYGDTATLRKIRIHGGPKKKLKGCTRFQGNSSGKEPGQLGSRWNLLQVQAI